jgi:predicted alpha/beta-hydrolase family hydrolase
MKSLTSFNFYHNSKTDTLDVVLQGGSHGIVSSILQKVFNRSKEKGNSVIAFNFPYFERGEENSSGPELKEELEALHNILDFVKYKEYSKVRLVGKSLGGIVASYYVESLTEEDSKRFSVVILGYVTGDVKLKDFSGSITVIQGEKDKFGGIGIVKEDLKDAVSKDIKYLEVKGADHSYRNPETKEPVFEDDAIDQYSLTF